MAILIDVVHYRIREFVADGDFSLAAYWLIEVILSGVSFPESMLKEIRTLRDKNPKFMYAIEDLLTGKEKNDELGTLTPNMHDKVIQVLSHAGWYGRLIDHPVLKIVYLRPKVKRLPA